MRTGDHPKRRFCLLTAEWLAGLFWKYNASDSGERATSGTHSPADSAILPEVGHRRRPRPYRRAPRDVRARRGPEARELAPMTARSSSSTFT